MFDRNHNVIWLFFIYVYMLWPWSPKWRRRRQFVSGKDNYNYTHTHRQLSPLFFTEWQLITHSNNNNNYHFTWSTLFSKWKKIHTHTAFKIMYFRNFFFITCKMTNISPSNGGYLCYFFLLFGSYFFFFLSFWHLRSSLIISYRMFDLQIQIKLDDIMVLTNKKNFFHILDCVKIWYFFCTVQNVWYI